MSSGSIKRKSFDTKIVKNISSLLNKLYFKSFNSSVKYSVPFSEFFTKNPKEFVYTDTRGTSFNKLHLEFQQIMKEEFLV